MGERIIRPGIRTSDRTAALIKSGGWMAQVFYDWMITVVDDYGRFDARPSLLRTTVFPLLLEVVREADVQRCLAECEKAGLVRLYTVDGKPFLELLNFKQRLRAKRSKWPPPGNGTSRQCHDIDVTMPTETETETEDPQPPAGDAEYPEGMLRFWDTYPQKGRNRSSKAKCERIWARDKLESRADVMLEALEHWKKSPGWRKETGEFVPGADRWLRDRKYEDPPRAAESTRARSVPETPRAEWLEHEKAIVAHLSSLEPTDQELLIADYKRERGIACEVRQNSAGFRAWLYERIQRELVA